MDQRLKVARIIVTACAVFLAVAPPIADLNETHILNPLWPGHARLHTVWLISTNSLIALVAIGVLWREALGNLRASVMFGATLIGAILVGFFVAAGTQSAYDGTLTDPNGIAMTAGPVDANAAAFSVLLLGVVTAFLMARSSKQTST